MLDDSQQQIVCSHLESTDSDIIAALDKVSGAAERRKTECEKNKTWTIQYHGETVSLSSKADKVLALCNRVKQIGDIAVAADPIHAGLPWAGIRLMLEVATAGRQQIAFLLEGFEVAFYLTNRLKAYIEYLADLPPNQATDNLEAALVKFFAFVLRFYADCIALYRKNKVARFLQAFFRHEPSERFPRRMLGT